MTSTYMMTMIMLPLLALMIFIGYYIFIPLKIRERNKRIPIRRFIIGFLPFFVSAFLVYMLVQSQYTIIKVFGLNINANYTKYFMMIEGDIVHHFQSFATPTLTIIIGFVYLMIFSFLLIFTFIILIYTKNLKALEEFTIAYIITYLVAFWFYIFFPVTVTGHTLPNVEPLLYNLNPIIDEGVRVVDPFLDNCFPSLHAAQSIMALLIIVFRTNLTRYKLFAIISTIAILFSTLYLGIHWISDLIAGCLLALFSCYIAIHYRNKISMMVNRVLLSIEIRAGILDDILCNNCQKNIRVIPHSMSVKCPYCGTIMKYHPLTYDQ
ncbi:MAG: PAP2 superfamily protein [ANME-2 cluster archaeon HR1]|nr:MAG: PAP2 superfamily protein [ANME-2 cluster archaeon HR1]